jgi:hypothetical protein
MPVFRKDAGAETWAAAVRIERGLERRIELTQDHRTFKSVY